MTRAAGGEGNRNKARGTRFEVDTARRLRAAGWFVIKAGGSLGPADLVALVKGATLLVQCKSGTGGEQMTHAEWNELLDLGEQLGAVAIVADRPARGVYRYRRIIAPHVPAGRCWPSALYPLGRTPGPRR